MNIHIFSDIPKFIEVIRPKIEILIHEYGLHIDKISRSTWEDPIEGIQYDYTILLKEPKSPEELVDLSSELAKTLNYDIPINVTIRFINHEHQS